MTITNSDVSAVGPIAAHAGAGAGPREGTTGEAASGARVSGQAVEHVEAQEVRTPAAEQIKLPEFRETELSFRIEEGLNRVVVQVIDSKTKTVLRSIPPEELVKLAKHFRATRGVLLDEQG
jgi:flagellar protein FlaG